MRNSWIRPTKEEKTTEADPLSFAQNQNIKKTRQRWLEQHEEEQVRLKTFHATMRRLSDRVQRQEMLVAEFTQRAVKASQAVLWLSQLPDELPEDPKLRQNRLNFDATERMKRAAKIEVEKMLQCVEQCVSSVKLLLVPIKLTCPTSGHATLLAIDKQGEPELKIRYYDSGMEQNKTCDERALQAGSHLFCPFC